jgi:HTH-type transcriptional regulator, sugar sensing transcriptional regulator
MNQHLNNETLTVLSGLKSLGFTDYESRVYLALLTKSPATAYEISNSSGVPRPNTYSALKALASRKAVMPVSANPIRYVPQPPERLFKSIATKTSELCNTVAERLSALTVDPGEHYVWDLSGDAEVHGKVAEMIGTAKSAIWVKADAEILRRHGEVLRKAAVGRGVRLLIILYGDDPDEFRFNDLCEVYEHEGTGFPMGFADNHFTITVDHRQMLTANRDDTVTASHTESRAIVKMAISLLRHDYYMAEIFRAFRSDIDSEFGPNLRRLRQHSYSPEQFALFEERQEERAGADDIRTSP